MRQLRDNVNQYDATIAIIPWKSYLLINNISIFCMLLYRYCNAEISFYIII